jgi:hypothetical protein
MSKRLSIVFIMMATWMVTGCGSITGGCFGHWVDDGLKRGTISWKNADYSKPYRQCVEKEAPHKNTEKIPYG